ncbi:hypothetical protein [Solimonas marina]|uniref:Uncharacterized protein n=1 Tax=Solimonas marina TaxID=2714601 RepID=A0A970B5A5_9GAMM|nr:hypothetical protein [Solimonas marina]NKF21335.1 hypothetical protein [Solimonas marina]
MTPPRRGLDVDRAIGGVLLIVLHELDSARGHARSVGERVRVAAGAHSMRRLWREQRALTRRAQRRRAADHALRRELWSGLFSDLRPHR